MSKKKVLVIDDEANIVTMVRSRLEAAGYEVISAFNGEDGLLKAKSNKPDAIILDIIMPGMDGGRVGEALHSDPQTKGIPVIFLTCLVDGKEVGSQHIIGGNIILAKPFKADELLRLLKDVIKE